MTPSSHPVRGFVYVATGAGYLQEACHSAASVRRHHAQLPICLITDRAPDGPHPFTEVQVTSKPIAHKPIDKLLAYDAPYEHCLFLDTDTYVLDDLSPIFDLLERFDLAALQDVNRGWDYELPGVPMTFSEFNTGVVAFRKTAAVEAFFASWAKEHETVQRELGFTTDQPAFRRALYHSALRIAPLPSEFHFLSNYPNSTLWKVRLLHGRGNYEEIARLANEELGRRAYLPNVGVVREYHGRHQWLKTCGRIAGRMARLLFRPPPDASAANPGQWWRTDQAGHKAEAPKDPHA